MSAVETVTMNKLIIETHRLTRYLLCIHQNDEMECYDIMI